MDSKKFLDTLDGYLHECRLEEAEEYLLTSLDAAKKGGDSSLALTVFNELIGFLRDCGKTDDMMRYCYQMLAAAREYGICDSPAYASQYGAALLNAANAARAAGLNKEAFEYYNKAYDTLSLLDDDHDPLYAGYYNNLSLLYQETGDWENAAKCLEKALEIAETFPDGEVQVAISSANLAATYIRLDRIDKAHTLLDRADRILCGRSPSDFHYSAVLAGKGDAAFKEGDYIAAAKEYEAALSEIELHMGKNNFYEIVSENLKKAYDAAGGRPHLSGKELCRRYYEQFGIPMIQRNFTEYADRISAGLMGEGSECLGYDDEISRDHDFGAGFCLWLDDDVYDKIGAELQRAYDLLPRSYMGINRITTPRGMGRAGVQRISDFLKRIIGIPYVPVTDEEWLFAEESALRTAVSGEIFSDSGSFSAVQKALSHYPVSVRLRRIAQQTALMAQTGQYNYPRAVKRGRYTEAVLILSRFAESAMNAFHLLKGVYAPYYKWLPESTRRLSGGGEFMELIDTLLCTDVKDTDKINALTEKICLVIRTILKEQNISVTEEDYMEAHAENAANKAAQAEEKTPFIEEIIRMEWEMFDKVQNEGGRADCQDDFETFSIMRKSQYLAWDTDMVKRWHEELRSAADNGRNLIMEKYARMMASTAPEKYAQMKDKLPPLSEETAQIREAVIGIQVGMMEEFAQEYPKLASRARAIRTSEDTLYITSYETYLRGELMTYSDELLYMYGRFVASLAGEGRNLARLIMLNTVYFYGYTSLEDAEKNA